MNSKLKIRKASKLDIDDFTTIKAAAYADDRTKSVPKPDEKPRWYDGECFVGLGIPDKEETERLMANFQCYMITLDNKSIGILWLHCEKPDSLTLEDFCILPQYQGKGFGSEALKLIEKLHPDNLRWLLTTPCFCKRNRHLYEKNGYGKIGLEADNTVIVYEKIINKKETNL